MLITNLIVAFTIFLLGFYVSCRYTSKSFKDGFYNKSDCPDLLVQNGDGLQLLNSNKAKIPGINPVRFNNLEEYVEFLHWQNGVGIKCPVLYFEKHYDVQGSEIYKIKDSPFDNIDLPENKKMPISDIIDANKNGKDNLHYQGYDKDNQYIGQFNRLDKFFEADCKKNSINAMHTCWAGEERSKSVFPDKLN